MAKMKVHELAKELEIESKVIVEFLKGTEYEVKAAQSSVEDAAQDKVRAKFGKKAAPAPKAEAPVKETTPAPKAETPVKEAAPVAKPVAKPAEASATAEGEKERPKKKSSITAVFNAQYSKQQRRPNPNGPRREGGHGPQGGPNREGVRPAQGGQGRPNPNGPRREGVQQAPKQEAHTIIRPRPVGERAMRPISERTPSATADLVMTSAPKAAPEETVKPQVEQRPERNERPERTERPVRAERPERTERPERGERPQRPERGERPQGERGDRPQRPQGDKNTFRVDNRQGRPDKGFDKGDKFDKGDRNGFRGNDRNDRNGGKGRFDREMDKFNKDAAPAEEMRGKESRERGKDDRRSNRHTDHDKLGSKRQENFVNLEKNGGKKRPQQPQQKPKEDPNEIKTITLPEKITIKDLADRMKVQPSVIIKNLFMKGTMVTVNHEVDFDTASEIALEFNFICEEEEKIDVIAELLKEEEENEADMVARPPVVCVMGHVDHGKTSLLDAIRSTKVTAREAGGITQHIGASVVSINGQNITFLDTPGHEAFTAMRMRGAKSTDIAILVVAADDGVMPQTVEAINHAKAAGVEIIVAINKIDKPTANIERVKQELTEHQLIAEDWGGSTIFCPVSAKTGEGIDNLLEMVLLTAEVLELKANPKRQARGLVIEAQLDKGRGAVATVLVQKGTLRVGDPVACGSSYGKVRAMIDDNGRRVKEAGPSTPVEILGLNSVPTAGETFVNTNSEKEAKEFAETYIAEEKNRLLEETKARMSLDDLFSQIQSGNMKELNLIVKADVQGSVEAVKQSLMKLSNEEVMIKVIHGGVGAVNESDITLAMASNAIIIGFNTRVEPMAKTTADREHVDVRLYKVIYQAIEDVEAAMKGMLDPIFEEKILGHAEIRQIFKASGVGNIAGSYVLDGTMERGCKVRISREGEQIFEGDLASLKRFKDDVKEVRTGYECGLVFDGFNDLQEFDIVEAYKMVEVPRK
ncbi:MAG: translation initiation factor IF-2 [Lachnospiraceae bacterium]|nr:translation initiation factor IF-2 [Lachnospiraceae bacterium]